MKIFQICDSPMAYYYSRQSNMINKFSEHQSRFYSNTRNWPKEWINKSYLDLTPDNPMEEIINELQQSDIVVFHATRNFKSKISAAGGEIDTGSYLNGKKAICLIHGQPETLNIQDCREFIRHHLNEAVFVVATANQLNLFPGTKLFPIIGLFSGSDPLYSPRADYLEARDHVQVIRRTPWKAQSFAVYLYKQVKNPGLLCVKFFIKKLLGYRVSRNDIFKPPSGEFVFLKNNKKVVFDNLLEWQPHQSVLQSLAESDILLENDPYDYPGGGTSHTIGLEAMSMGIPAVNFITEKNGTLFAEFIKADELPPFKYYDNENHFKKDSLIYLEDLMYDTDYLIHRKKKCREYFLKYLDVDKTIPLVTDFLEKC